MKQTLLLTVLAIVLALNANGQKISGTTEISTGWEYTHFPYCETDEEALRIGKTSLWRKAVVPGTVQMDMRRDGMLPDLYFGQNFYSAVWLENEDFLYRTTFAKPDVEPNARIWLDFKGLDNFATIWLNSTQVAKTHNMFKTYSYDVTDMLKEGENTLLIRLAAPMKEVYKVMPNAAANMQQLSGAFFVKERLVTRKVQMNYGWDNVPRIITSGIYRPVILRVCQSARIDNVWFRTTLAEDHSNAAVSVQVELVGDHPFDGEVETILSLGDKSFSARSDVEMKKAEQPATSLLKFDVPNPELWWPAGLGEQPLYNLTVNLLKEGKITDSYTERVGIREVKVVTGPAEKRMVNYRIGNPDRKKPEVMDGGFVGAWSKVPLEKPEEVEVTPLKFYVNGRYVFMKGFNFQPLDVFESNLTKGKYDRSIRAAKEMGCNMLRVWGGGNVENDWFYDACDENGILVWQDFFYASGQYPNDAEFLAETEDEIINIVKRLRNRTCLAAWCGDNESDMVNHDRGKGQYSNKISHEVQKKVMAIYDPERYWHPSSPSGGGYPRSPWGGDKRNWGAASPADDYAYIRGDEGRFISEGGASSIAQLSSVRKYMPWNFEWPINSDYYFMHWGDVPTMRRDFLKAVSSEISQHFGVAKNLPDFIYLSQIFQAHGIPRMAQHFRSRMDECGGVLLWKWADTWPSICYSVIDYEEFKKPGWYTLKRAFAPTTLMVDNQAERLTVKYINDGPKKNGNEVVCRLAKYDGTVVREWRETIAFQSNSAGMAIDPNLSRKDLMSGEYYIKIWVDNDPAVEPYYYIPTDMIAVKTNLTDVTVSVKRIDASTAEVTFTSPEYVPYVVIWSNNPYISMSDNAFFLEKGASKTIRFTIPEGELWGDFTYRWWNGETKTFTIDSELLKPVEMKPTVYP